MDGRTFDSNAEYERWLELRIMERKGLITDLKEHPEFEIIPRQVSKAGKEVREKIQSAAVEVNEGDFFDPEKLTVKEWFDIWLEDFSADKKPYTMQL
ncbi:MAG: DUF1064 domain-containing protein [Oscillospiraceae bacterium]|nr:DUF1064 domain-containing protein [Oscillospiraceae bacterium]